MTGDCHVRILESAGVRLPCATYPYFLLSAPHIYCDIRFSTDFGLIDKIVDPKQTSK